MGVAILTQHVMSTCQKNKGDMLLTTKGLPERRIVSFIKVSGRMHINAFKRPLHSSSFGLKQLSTTIKTFHYYGTGV